MKLQKNIYTDFSEVYDYMLRHVDYDKWYQYLRTIMLKYTVEPQMILELGCGTGRFGAKFSKDNFTIYGIDRSLEMLKIAKIRAYRNFRIFCADMRNFRLSRKIDFIFSVHDTMNYFLTYGDLEKVFAAVKRVMHDKSIFMFDITTEYNIMRFFDQKISHDSFRDVKIKWENVYDPEKKMIHSMLRFKKPNGSVTTEEHIQRIYQLNEIKILLEKQGFKILDVFNDYSFSPIKPDAIMINFITCKK